MVLRRFKGLLIVRQRGEHHRISCAFVPIASRSCLWARKALDVPIKPLPRLEAIALTTYSCHRKLCRRRVPKSATLKLGTPRRRSILLQSFVFVPTSNPEADLSFLILSVYARVLNWDSNGRLAESTHERNDRQ